MSTEMVQELFFPEFLNKGSKGPPVAALQLLLQIKGCNAAAIDIDGIYGDETAKGVIELQRMLEVDEDGHFGPDTRAALKARRRIDINVIPMSAFVGETVPVTPT